MPRLLGEHFNDRGRPKKGFVSKKSAKQWAQARYLSMEAYPCTFCDKWHLATPKKEKGRAP